MTLTASEIRDAERAEFGDEGGRLDDVESMETLEAAWFDGRTLGLSDGLFRVPAGLSELCEDFFRDGFGHGSRERALRPLRGRSRAAVPLAVVADDGDGCPW